jgi:WD40 repeat protein
MALFGRDARVQAVAFSSDSRWLASLDFYGNLIKWDLDRALPIWTVSIKRTERTLAISPDNRWIVATNAVFASESGQKVVDFDESDPRLATVYGLAFSNDSKWLICVEADGHLTQISVGEWRMIERFEAQASQFIAVSFSPDGRRFVTGDDEGRVRLWSINPLRELDLIGRHSSRVKSVAFSPDGSRVASAGDDRNIFIWDVSQHRLITSVGTNTAPILSITFSADGEKLLSGANDNSAHVFTRHRTLWGYRMS